jgi:O-antigen ligase
MLAQALEKRLGTLIPAGVLALAALAPLAYGCVEPKTIALFQLFTALLVAACAVRAALRGEVRFHFPAACWPLSGMLLVGLAQSVTFTGSDGVRRGLSLDAEATQLALLLQLCLVLTALVGANSLAAGEWLRRLGWFAAVFGLALAGFALLQHFTWNGRIYWVRELSYAGSEPFGPFVNRNHFAGQMELLMGIPLALAVTGAVKGQTRFFFSLAVVVMGVAAAASLSRGGMLSVTVEVLAVMILSPVMRRRQSRVFMRERPFVTRRHGWGGAFRGGLLNAAAGLAIILSLALGVWWVASEQVLGRVASEGETFDGSRGWVWRDTVALIKAHPFLGAGIGAYGTAVPLHGRYDGSQGALMQAHNDYLQALADGGLLGGALALWFIAAVARSVWRGLRSADRRAAGVTLGCGAGFLALLVHSAFDFNLQIPANALAFLLLSLLPSAVEQASGAEDSRRAAPKSERVSHEAVLLEAWD